MQAVKPLRVQYGVKMQNILAGEHDFWSRVIMRDEAHFTLCRIVNSQNVHYWDTENPQIMEKVPLHLRK